MNIRRAVPADLPGINRLLRQVLEVHHNGRPDLFKTGVKKYNDEELYQIIADDSRPIFCAVDDEGELLGYAFCVMTCYQNDSIFTDRKTLYIDDLCVDEQHRGMQIGQSLFAFVKAYAAQEGCYNITLNVWSCNDSARRFYDKCGLVPQKIGMEMIL